MSERQGRLLHAQNEYYNERVLMPGWDIKLLALPKDNDPYHPPGGNYFLSTYNCIGDPQRRTPHSETHDMLRQVFTHRVNRTPGLQQQLHWQPTVVNEKRQSFRYLTHLTVMKRDYQPHTKHSPQNYSVPTLREELDRNSRHQHCPLKMVQKTCTK